MSEGTVWDIQLGLEDGGEPGRGWGSFWMDGEGTSGILSSPAWAGSMFWGGQLTLFTHHYLFQYNI